MQILNKYYREALVIKMHKEGKTIRRIAATAHVSFGDIGKIIRKIDGPTDDSKDSNDIDLSKKSQISRVSRYRYHGHRLSL